MAVKDEIPRYEDDGLYAPSVGGWALEKYTRVWLYDQLFSRGMKYSWDVRVYIDLFAAAGKATLRNTGEIVAASPLLALSVPDRFDKYIFCDESEENIEILRMRVEKEAPDVDVSYVVGDVNEHVDEIIDLIPQKRYNRSVLSFCFVDPFSLRIKFDTLRRLADGRPMDFLVLLALWMDANRNISVYMREESTRLSEFLGRSDWRKRWQKAQAKGENLIYFLASEYAKSMSSIGYLDTTPEQMFPVRSDQKNLPLYYLAFFSKHKRGYKFWNEVLKYSTDQMELAF